mmetsp:Transcript_105805/g.304052  ORF Transcript_105805/g.304052 Transcript_105805/m.304052 type:complete len:265 (+) Transcript_105805:2282-3076(+)
MLSSLITTGDGSRSLRNSTASAQWIVEGTDRPPAKAIISRTPCATMSRSPAGTSAGKRFLILSLYSSWTCRIMDAGQITEPQPQNLSANLFGPDITAPCSHAFWNFPKASASSEERVSPNTCLNNILYHHFDMALRTLKRRSVAISARKSPASSSQPLRFGSRDGASSSSSHLREVRCDSAELPNPREPVIGKVAPSSRRYPSSFLRSICPAACCAGTSANLLLTSACLRKALPPKNGQPMPAAAPWACLSRKCGHMAYFPKSW